MASAEEKKRTGKHQAGKKHTHAHTKRNERNGKASWQTHRNIIWSEHLGEYVLIHLYMFHFFVVVILYLRVPLTHTDVRFHSSSPSSSSHSTSTRNIFFTLSHYTPKRKKKLKNTENWFECCLALTHHDDFNVRTSVWSSCEIVVPDFHPWSDIVYIFSVYFRHTHFFFSFVHWKLNMLNGR